MVAAVVATLGIAATAGCGGSEVVTEAAGGECFQGRGGPSDERGFDKVMCNDAHDGEVVSVFQLDGSDFPGQEAVEAEARLRCSEDFEHYVGTPVEESTLDLRTFAPTEETWEDEDREVICTAFLADGSRLGASIRGSGR